MNYQDMQQLNKAFLKKIDFILQDYDVSFDYNAMTLKEKTKKNEYASVVLKTSIVTVVKRHLVVSVGFNQAEYKITNSEQAYMLVKEYWEEFTKLRGMEGFVFVCHKQKLTDELLQTFGTHYGLGNRHDQYDALITSISTLSNYRVFFASYSQRFMKSAENYGKVIRELKSLFKEKPSLKPHEQRLSQLFNKEILVRYAGISIYLQSIDEYQKIKVWEIGKEDEYVTLPVDKEHILSLLNTIKEKQRLRNIIEEPRRNFNKVLYKLIEHYSLDGFYSLRHPLHSSAEKAYQELSKIGDWEDIENEMGYIFYELTNNSSFVLKRVTYYEEKDLMLIIKKLKTPNYYYLFCYTADKEEENALDFKIFCSKKDDNYITLQSYLRKIEMI